MYFENFNSKMTTNKKNKRRYKFCLTLFRE